MIITYLILTHSNLNHLKLLIDSLNDENSKFVIHIDKKCTEDYSFLLDYKNVKLMQNRHDVIWGGISIIETILDCLKEVIKSKCDYIILLSGTDYPLKSKDYISRFISENRNKDFIEGYPFPSPDCHWLEGGRRRLECYALHLGDKNIATIEPRKFDMGNVRQLGKILINSPFKILKAVNILLKFPQRSHPQNLTPYRGEMWWGLRRTTVNIVLKYIENDSKYLSYHKNTCIPDEIFMSTLVYNLIPKSQIINSSLRFINWKEEPRENSPHDISISNLDIRTIENTMYLFGRKITDKTTIDVINKYLNNYHDSKFNI